MAAVRAQAVLFELPADELARKKRMAGILRDRKVARYLIKADSWERETIEMLMECEDLSLYEAIEMCIKHPVVE